MWSWTYFKLSANCVIIYTNVNNQAPTFTITETNLYVPIVTLSIQDNEKLLPQLKSGFKRKISWNKYLAKPELLVQNTNLNYLIKSSSQRVHRLFVLEFENDEQKTSNKRYYIPNIEIKDYNVMIDGKNVFDQPVRNDKVAYNSNMFPVVKFKRLFVLMINIVSQLLFTEV